MCELLCGGVMQWVRGGGCGWVEFVVKLAMGFVSL